MSDPTDDSTDSTIGLPDPVEAALALAAAPVTMDEPRLAALEDRIMGSVANDWATGAIPIAAVPAGVSGAVHRRSRLTSLLAAAAAVLVLVVGALAVGMLADDDEVLAIGAADRVVVELPDGETFDGEAGTELPDGTRLEVAGFVEVDGRRFGPGSYHVVDGALRANDIDGSATTLATDRDLVSTTMARSQVGPAGGSPIDPTRSDESGDSRGGSDGRTVDPPDGDGVPVPTDPVRSTAPPHTTSPDVDRPPRSTAPTRPAATDPVRPTTTSTETSTSRPGATTTPARRSTTTVTSTTRPSTTSTTPSRTTVPDGGSRDGRP